MLPLAVLGAFLLQGAATSAVIVNSGSTNAPGYRIEVERSGDSRYVPQPRTRGFAVGPSSPTSHKIPEALARRFFSDLETAGALSQLPIERCAKSASFGSSTFVEFGGERTPDISCPGARDPNTKALMRDVNEILAIFRPQ